jgi:hypothetical protein
MRRILIHIGYHKTATSWLQRYLFGRRDRGFCPVAPADGLTAKQAAKFMSHYFVYDQDGKLLSPFRSRAEEIRDFMAALQVPDSLVPVMSAERLSGNPHASGFDAKVIAERLVDSFPDARILIVIREQTSMILSTYFQFLKTGGDLSLEAYLGEEYDGRRPGFAPANLEYHRLIGHYQEQFGAANVHVLPYETFSADGPRAIAELADFAGAQVTAELEFDVVPNRGLPRLVEYRTRLLNPLIRPTSLNAYSPWAMPLAEKPVRWLRQATASVLPPGAERKFVAKLREDIQANTEGRYGDSNKRTAELIGIDLSALGYQ